MKFGVFLFPTDQTIQPADLARAAEDLGFESLWFPEHSHIPVARLTPWGGVQGAAPLPEHYWRTHDQFVALSFAAAVTTRLKLGTGVTLVAQRDPVWLAKEVASLDHLSGGRLMFGIGYGWNKEEMASHGVAYHRRRGLLREKVLLMKSLWLQEEASFDGELVNLEPSWSWPKPIQRPHPPIIMGAAAGPATLTHMVEFCDGWMPLGTRHGLSDLPAVRRALAASGRDPDSFEITLYHAKAESRVLEELVEKGIHRVVFTLPQRSPAEVLERLKRLAEVVAAHPA